MTRLMLTSILVVTALLAFGCGGSSREHQAAGTPRTLTDLYSINQLQHAFNGASGEPRLIVLVSPT